jgi:hypothetical protein
MNAPALNDQKMTLEEVAELVNDCAPGERLLLNTRGNLVYSGTFTKKIEVDGEEGLLLKLDAKSGLSIWCPMKYVGRLQRVFKPVEKA